MKSFELGDGPIMIIVFVCLAVAMSFISFGLGLVNLVKDTSPAPLRAEVSEQERQNAEITRREIQVLQHEWEQLTTQIAKQQTTLPATQTSPEGQDKLHALQDQSEELAKQIAELVGRVTELEKDFVAKTNSAKEAEFQVADARRQIDEADRSIDQLQQSIKDKQKVDVLKLGGSMKDPQIVECVKDEIVLQPQGARVSIRSIKGSDAKFVNAVRQKEVFFLVRPSGYESFDAALIAAQNLRATVGYEPVDEDWPMKFR
jgi:predicted RNase H-like nuclease (RuvC/YqgF family)